MTKGTCHAHYQPSGGFRSVSLPPILLGLVATSVAIGGFYFTLLSHGWYYGALSLLIPVMISCGFIRWAVQYAHCRNRLLAGTLGACCGLGGFALYFHIDQCVRWNAPPAAIDRLPGYIAFRMNTDYWIWFAKGAILTPQAPSVDVQPAAWPTLEGRAAWNWRLLLLEALALALAPLATALRAASRPYSERWRRWCDCESIFVEKQQGAAVRKALTDGSLEQWVAGDPHLVTDRQPHCKLTLWYARSDDPDEGMADVLLSINDGSRLRLKSREAAAFVNLLPSMRASCGVKPTSEQPNLRTFDANVAYIWPVPKSSRKRRFRLGHELRRLVKGLKIALPVCGLFLVLMGGGWAIEQWLVKPGLVNRWLLAAFIITAGFPLALRVGLNLPFQRLWQINVDVAQWSLLE
jgi:hypothetical protein